MKKVIVMMMVLFSMSCLTVQAQSTASGSSNTGNGTTGSSPAQNGSTGPTVSNGSAGTQNGSGMQGRSRSIRNGSNADRSTGSMDQKAPRRGTKSKSTRPTSTNDPVSTTGR